MDVISEARHAADVLVLPEANASHMLNAYPLNPRTLPLKPPGPWRHHFFRNLGDDAEQELSAALAPRNEPRQWLLTPKPQVDDQTHRTTMHR